MALLAAILLARSVSFASTLCFLCYRTMVIVSAALVMAV